MKGLENDMDNDDDQPEDTMIDEQEPHLSKPSPRRPYPDSGNETGPIRQSGTDSHPLAKVVGAMGPQSTLVSPASARPSPTPTALTGTGAWAPISARP